MALAIAVPSAVVLVAPAGAHTPHDDQRDVAVSPDFATDQRVWTIAQGLLLRSDDAGATWAQLQNGVPADVTHVEVSPADPSVLYVLTPFDGIHRTADGGDSWQRAATSPAVALRDIAVSPIDPSTVLLSTPTDGTHLSTDGGDTWQALPAEQVGTAVAFGAEAALLVGGEDGRVHRSVDNGLTWTTADAAAGVAITALVGGGDETVYAGTADGQVLRSDDDGRTFATVAAPDSEALPGEPVVSIARSPDHATDNTVWASLESSGAFRSTDRGATWTTAADGLTTDPQADVGAQPDWRTITAADGALFLAGFDGLFRSTDGGDSWLSSETLAERIVAVAVSPDFATDHTVAVATYLKGAFISTDAGETWQPLRDGLEYPLSPGNELVPLKRMHGMAFSPAYSTDGTIYSASWVGSLRHRPDSWTEVLVGQGGPDAEPVLQQFVTAVDADGTIVMGSAFGELHRSTEQGDEGSWEVVGRFEGEARSVLVDPTSDDVWVATSTDVQVSRDGGQTFEPTGLGRPSMAAAWFGPDGPTVFAGTADGLFVSDDGGASWVPVGVAGDDSVERVEALGVSPAFDEDGLVLVSLGSRGLFRSTDGGGSFRPVAAELLAEDQLIGEFLSNATGAPIQFSPQFADDGTVFAFSDRSVLRSTDQGSTWDVLTLPSVFQVLVDTAPGQLDLIVTPTELPAPTPAPTPEDGDDATGATAAWGVIIASAGVVAVLVVLRRRRRRG